MAETRYNDMEILSFLGESIMSLDKIMLESRSVQRLIARREQEAAEKAAQAAEKGSEGKRQRKEGSPGGGERQRARHRQRRRKRQRKSAARLLRAALTATLPILARANTLHSSSKAFQNRPKESREESWHYGEPTKRSMSFSKHEARARTLQPFANCLTIRKKVPSSAAPPRAFGDALLQHRGANRFDVADRIEWIARRRFSNRVRASAKND